MSWSPTHPGEILLDTLMGQAATGLGGGFGTRQIPIHPVDIGYPVPADFVSSYKGVRVRMEFTGAATPTSTGWFAYVYLGDRAYDPGQVGHLPGNLGSPILSSVDAPFNGVLDFWFSATRFPYSPTDFAIWSGAGTYSTGAFGSGTLDNSSLNHPGSKASLASSFLQVYMGQSGATEYQIQPSVVYISEFPTADTPEVPPAPSIFPVSGTYQGTQLLTILATGGTVHYTTDGSDPTALSPVYASGYRIQDGTTIKAVTVSPEGLLSPVSSASYRISGNKIVSIPSYTAHVLPYLLEQYKGDNP